MDFIDYFTTSDHCQIRYGMASRLIPSEHNPTVLLLQGRASFLEKFQTIIHGFCHRGYNVVTFDWRGQGLSSRCLTNPRKGHIDCYTTYLKDLHDFLQQKVMPCLPYPFIVVGQSMGSHLALRYMVDYKNCFHGAILTAPLIDLNTGGYSPLIAKALSKFFVKIGLSGTFVWGQGLYDPLKEPFEGNMLTHDRKSFLLHRSLQKNNPSLSIGGVTYGWVHATFKSIHKLNHPSVLSQISIPVLVIAAGQESVVDNHRLNKVVSWIPKAELKVYSSARHQILSEVPALMKQFWRDFDAFKEKHISPHALKDVPVSLSSQVN